VLVSLTVLVLLQSSNLWKEFSVETASDTLLLYALSSLNFIAFVIFGFIFLRSITKLMRERRTLQLGAKIKTRLLLYFAAVSLLPIIAMAAFSYLFMNRALERWFAQFPTDVLIQAKDVQGRTIAEEEKRLNETAAMIASTLDNRSVTDHELDSIAEAGNLTRVELLSPANQVIASGGAETALEKHADEIAAFGRVESRDRGHRPSTVSPRFHRSFAAGRHHDSNRGRGSLGQPRQIGRAIDIVEEIGAGDEHHGPPIG